MGPLRPLWIAKSIIHGPIIEKWFLSSLFWVAVCRWHNVDHDGARGAVSRLLDEEPEFRVSDMMALPFRDAALWERFLDGLRAAGAPN